LIRFEILKMIQITVPIDVENSLFEFTNKTYPNNYFLTSMANYWKVAIDCVSMKTYDELQQN